MVSNTMVILFLASLCAAGYVFAATLTSTGGTLYTTKQAQVSRSSPSDHRHD
jgi:hypothetical protein